ncbi:MAG: thioredoxin family protein [Chlamydiia bacterium]|nr:thioredoxin family protein [Chlamydiia bacterium]
MLAPLLIFLAIILLLFKLPGFLELIGQAGCLNCAESSIWIPMIAGGYFAFLFAAMLLYPARFTPQVSKAGLFWALALAVSLTLTADELCYPCLMAHAAHIAAWGILCFFPLKKPRLKAYLLLISPMIAASFFLGLNLTLRLLDLTTPASGPSLGENISFVDTPYLKGADFKKFETTNLFFAGPNCPYCKAAYPKLESLANNKTDNSTRFIALTRNQTDEMKTMLPSFEWIEDPKGTLIQALKVKGFPTLIQIDQGGKVKSVRVGGDI